MVFFVNKKYISKYTGRHAWQLTGLQVLMSHRSVLQTIGEHAQAVMKELGPGHRESVYAKALSVSLWRAGVAHRTEVDIPVLFCGECVGHGRADLIVGSCVVEIKALRHAPREALAQLAKYVDNLRAVERRVFHGVVVNFGQKTGEVTVLHLDTLTEREKPRAASGGKRSRFFAEKKAPAAAKRKH